MGLLFSSLAIDMKVLSRIEMPVEEASITPHQRRTGIITGPLLLRDSHGLHDLHASIWAGPNGSHEEQVTVVKHAARFVLLVEKKNIFGRLCADDFHLKGRCVLASGDGYPGRSFHRVLRKICDQIALPLYVLADNDPGGYELFFLVARGTARCRDYRGANHNALAIRQAAFIGMRTRDYSAMGMGEWASISLSEPDRAQLNRISSCAWLKSDDRWQEEIRTMASRGFKVELEATFGLSPTYLADTYLPERIAANDHLRLASVTYPPAS